ncbi:MAG: hypothetical protein JST94_02375 [Bacteroidetes bacterium]|nr:hypothetical protein [Bacteroidota bacterium]MBS1670292.1 hypothetical protein [Bacteroidota bacterium]
MKKIIVALSCCVLFALSTFANTTTSQGTSTHLLSIQTPNGINNIFHYWIQDCDGSGLVDVWSDTRLNFIDLIDAQNYWNYMVCDGYFNFQPW